MCGECKYYYPRSNCRGYCKLKECVKNHNTKNCGNFTENDDFNISQPKWRECAKEHRQLAEWLKELKQLKEQTRWIPVSERLPKVNQRVLVTSYGRVCYAMMISADGNSGHPVFKLQDSLNEKVVCETTVHNIFTTSRITAWMPLPAPYKAESEGKDIRKKVNRT